MKNIIYQNALKISEKYCTKSFVYEIQIIHNERERFLSNSWKNNGVIDDSQNDIRRIDMDTITILAEKKLRHEQYINFIYEIAINALDYREVLYSEELLIFLITNYKSSVNDELYGYILQKLGNIQMYNGNIQRATKHYTDSLAVFRKTDNKDAIEMLENDLYAITNKSKITIKLDLNLA